MIIALEFVRIQLHRIWPRRIFALDSNNWWVKLAIYAGTVMAVAIALKVLNNVRIEIKLEEQERLLLQARMEALQSQINPHFLFNTLNSVSSLVRFDPDTAREMIVKLANILRRLLRKTTHSFPCSEESNSSTTISTSRWFASDATSCDASKISIRLARVAVPSMMLQPLVENSIKHGLSSEDRGRQRLLAQPHAADAGLVIEVEDDGVGMAAKAGQPTAGTGIGMANVAERLKALRRYGAA